MPLLENSSPQTGRQARPASASTVWNSTPLPHTQLRLLFGDMLCLEGQLRRGGIQSLSLGVLVSGWVGVMCVVFRARL